MDTTLKIALPDPSKITLERHTHAPEHSIQHGSTTVLRTGSTAHREELFMQRSRDRRTIKLLRAQLDKARRRRFAKTQVPVELLDQLLTRIEQADA